jgi:hypothetical protein
MANDAGEAARIPKLAKEREDAKALLAKRKKVPINRHCLKCQGCWTADHSVHLAGDSHEA